MPEGLRPTLQRAWVGARRRVRRLLHRNGLPPVCDDVAAWASAHAGTASIAVLPPLEIHRSLPHTVEPEVNELYRKRMVHHARGRYLVPLRGARILGLAGIVILADGSFAAESTYTRARLVEDPDYFATRRRPVVDKPGDHFSLLVIASRHFNYYHWLHDSLQRLVGVFEHLPADTRFIVPPNLKPVQRESLRAAGVPDERTDEFTGDEVWKPETLWFAPHTTRSGNDRRDADVWLRDQVLGSLGITTGTPWRKVFVSRRDASERRMVNEDEVEEIVGRYGFETYVLEELSFRAQVALWTETAAVVAPHGAGLTNMIFAPEGLRILEVIEPGIFGNAHDFWTMADQLGHEYWYVTADAVPVPGRQNDTRVHTDRISATLTRMGFAPEP